MLTDQFPEIVEEAASWSGSIVLDGELLAWDHDSPAPFSELQRRLGRKNVSVKMRNDVPVLFMSYDLLEFDGVDFRNKSTQERRSILQSWSSGISLDTLESRRL